MSDDETVALYRLAALLNDAENVMHGVADEIAARRPHPDAHLYDIEKALRVNADHLERSHEEVLQR